MLEPHPAATVIVARESRDGIEIFLLRRSSRSAFMPDVFVFPGGRVDAEDGSPIALTRMSGATPGAHPAHVFAAARETFEEAGLLFASSPIGPEALARGRSAITAGTCTFAALLAELDTYVDARSLRYFSRWVTPPTEQRRFDTHFFVARAPAGQTAQADESETHDGFWIQPAAALARNAANQLALIFPTIKHLERITNFAFVDDLLAYAETKTIRTVTPAVDMQNAFCIPAALEGVW